eukprot:TRINITY_DN102693_c0_g1_i1.p1 TRINITY_DN102693_c0_g1~~TRINITY_DN102693_c0_g1_i1.p1  ORF type:complete len:612 (+),score=96.09 TRINITY_DN102693_c0_g1_i1:82-1917(+)
MFASSAFSSYAGPPAKDRPTASLFASQRSSIADLGASEYGRGSIAGHGGSSSSHSRPSAARSSGTPSLMRYGDDGPGSSPTNSSGGHFLLTLQFLGIAGLPGAGFLERHPGYEFIVQAGPSAKRLRPRVPAPPPAAGGALSTQLGGPPANVEELVPEQWRKDLVKLDERIAVRLEEPAPFMQIDVWEERVGLFDFTNKAPPRRLLGQCFVPLEAQFNRRPCSWTIVSRGDQAADIGCLTLKFGLATSPGPVRNLHSIQEDVGATEVHLVWEPPAGDGGTYLRGYRLEVVEASASTATADPDGIRTASAPPSATPSCVLKGLRGNTVYKVKVWAMSEAGPGQAAEILASTAAIAPGLCGLPQPARGAPIGAALANLRRAPSTRQDDGYFVIEWTPPEDTGGAEVVAYRVWLQPLLENVLGDVLPAEGWIDLGLTEHRPREFVQRTPLLLAALPVCGGCLCSVAAINSAGHMGPATPEVIVIASESPHHMLPPGGALEPEVSGSHIIPQQHMIEGLPLELQQSYASYDNSPYADVNGVPYPDVNGGFLDDGHPGVDYSPGRYAAYGGQVDNGRGVVGHGLYDRNDAVVPKETHDRFETNPRRGIPLARLMAEL